MTEPKYEYRVWYEDAQGYGEVESRLMSHASATYWANDAKERGLGGVRIERRIVGEWERVDE